MNKSKQRNETNHVALHIGFVAWINATMFEQQLSYIRKIIGISCSTDNLRCPTFHQKCLSKAEWDQFLN